MRYYYHGTVYNTAEAVAIAAASAWNWAKLANLLRTLNPGTLVKVQGHDDIVVMNGDTHAITV